VSGHAGFSAAAAAVLGALIPQNADEYFDAAAEAADSRVFGGIHYWFDSAQGVALGTDVAGEALAQAGVAPVSGVDPIEARLELDDAAARP
jgi:membrane-associated phospholipid phosphatase